MQALSVKVAIITVPEVAAADCYQRAIDAGVKGILNFSPITLRNSVLDDGSTVVVHNINIALELEQIFYELQFPKQK